MRFEFETDGSLMVSYMKGIWKLAGRVRYSHTEGGRNDLCVSLSWSVDSNNNSFLKALNVAIPALLKIDFRVYVRTFQSA